MEISLQNLKKGDEVLIAIHSPNQGSSYQHAELLENPNINKGTVKVTWVEYPNIEITENIPISSILSIFIDELNSYKEIS